VNLDESLAADDELADLEWEGHVVGDVWQVRLKGRVFLDREIITSVGYVWQVSLKGRVFLDRQINTIMGDLLASQTQRDCLSRLRNQYNCGWGGGVGVVMFSRSHVKGESF
jgi:hypothetical protein